MPRPITTPVQRAQNIHTAAQSLPMTILAAVDALKVYGPEDERTLKAWAKVEIHGATIHRQSRLLAGKSKGG